VEFTRRNLGLLLAGVAYAILSCYFIWQDKIWYTLFPFALIAVYYAIYQTEWAFLSLALFTPLSINIEEYSQSFGLFIPTEPLLFGFMLLVILMQIQRPIIPKEIWKNPIIWAISFYIFWVFITSITSSDPVASLKFLLARLWFLIPMLLLGTYVFRDKINITRFFWLFSIGMIIAITYTLIVHASYRFGEKESHWVMWPFFKDHTIYGAIVALVIPLIFGLYFSKKHTPLIQATLLTFIGISLLGLYFSYTRAAWLSIIAALGVWALIRFKIKFSLLAAVTVVAGSILFFSWDSIQMELERNKSEHTTEEFGERLQSATNVSSDASNLERLNRWSCAISMFKERPIFGFGPGTYSFEYARFQEPENLTIISTNFGNLGNAHSEFLGPLAEMGLIGLLSICLIIATIFYKAITLYNRWPSEDKEIRVLLMAIILSLTTYFVHGVLNNFLDTDKAAVPIWGMCAMIMALEISLDGRSVEKVKW
jgi:O-antigen ligase